jgi:glyoxylase-like metal-dependent hydrolase (beta-lactamase superfamily II)
MGSWLDLGGLEARGVVLSRFRLAAGTSPVTRKGMRRTRFAKADQLGRIQLLVRGLLLRTRDTLVLVDAGLGAAAPDGQGAQGAAVDLHAALTLAGIDPRAIKHLILTHLHRDHAAGIATRDASGALCAALPGARIYLQREAWDAARASDPPGGEAMPPGYVSLLAQLDLALLSGAAEVLPRIRVRPAGGHAPGMQIVIAQGDHGRLYHPADLLPTLAHLRSPGSLGYDAHPAQLGAEKEALLREVASLGGMLFFVHDPRTMACWLRPARRGFGISRTLAGMD